MAASGHLKFANYLNVKVMYPVGRSMLQVSIKNTFCAWALTVTVSLIQVEAALALWVYLIECTTFILGFLCLMVIEL